MPLDFYLAKTKQHSPYEPVLGSFDELTHRIIFERSQKKLENKFPFFKRLSDYFKDAHFAYEELSGLQSEIVQLKETFNKNSAVLTHCVKKQLLRISVFGCFVTSNLQKLIHRPN